MEWEFQRYKYSKVFNHGKLLKNMYNAMVHINNTTQPNPYMAQLLTKCMTSVEDAITKEFKWARSIAQWQKKPQ